ncbi:hypothetical protein EDC01DRAFT_631319 [Geopyxis carbonaria]|nr:hypothetical protein EDC01DRAFT_631319 [Geopyxis carbonaria]
MAWPRGSFNQTEPSEKEHLLNYDFPRPASSTPDRSSVDAYSLAAPVWAASFNPPAAAYNPGPPVWASSVATLSGGYGHDPEASRSGPSATPSVTYSSTAPVWAPVATPAAYTPEAFRRPVAAPEACRSALEAPVNTPVATTPAPSSPATTKLPFATPSIVHSPRVGSPSGESSTTVRGNNPRRAHLQDVDRLFLIKLCVQHQGDHRERNIGRFWRKISALLKDGIGVELRDPSRTVNNWVNARRPVLAKQVTESGTVQSDTEFTQALDKWIEHLDTAEQLKKDAIKPVTQQDREKEEAAVHRANMFATIANKHYLSDFETDEEDANELAGDARELDANEAPVGDNIHSVDSSEERDTIKSIRRLRKKTRRTDKSREQSEQSLTETRMVVSAFGNMGEVMAKGMREGLAELASSNNSVRDNQEVVVPAVAEPNISARLDNLEQELREQRRAQDAQSTENNAVLNRILLLMQQNQPLSSQPPA